ncbi:MAG: nitrilase-related carbon-nitrogen hydrolase, partial [Pseudomonadota bacterium]
VRTISVNPHSTPWDPVLYAIDVSGKLNTDLATKKQTLERCNSALLAAKNLARALVSLLQAVGRNLSLIPNHVEQWNEFLARLIIFTQEACWLISTEETDDQILVTLWKDNNGNISKLYQLEKEFPNNFDVASFTAFFSDMLLSFGKRIYKDLFDEFTANPAVKKLPSPFIIDFGKIGYSASDKMFEYSVQIISPKDVPRPDTVKIALSNWGIPMNYYDFNHLDFKRFIADDLHALKESIIAAIVTAEENGANALIFPEFFIPRQFEDEIIKIAKDRGIVLVGGLEARTDHQGKIFNETIVCLPGFPQPFYQRKHHPSQEEPNTERFPKADTLYYFTNTTIGNFAVVVCSDYRELSYHKVITEQIYPEIIIVCTMNHAPELYQAMAVADADRYYSHVIVCNNYNDGEEFSTRGTLIASPKKMIDDYIRKPNSDELIKIEAPLVADQQPSLWIVNLDLNAIAHRDRGRPEKGFRNPPHCRR